jgi:hypothetical protein
MTCRFSAFAPFVLLAWCLFALPIYPQTAAVTTRTAVPPRYDITKELTLTGTVSNVVKTPAPGENMLPGSHLMVATGSGKLDASLGKYAMRSAGILSITPGQHVRVTGVIMASKDQQVFVTRLVQANGHTYTIRNEHGIALAPPRGKGNRSFYVRGGQL